MEFRIDGKVVMAPIIREPVLGGSMVILGNFTTEEVSEMVRKIQAGALIEVAVPEAFAEAGQALRHAHFSSAPQGTK